MREVVGAEQADLFSGDEDEEHGAARRLWQTGVSARDLEQ